MTELSSNASRGQQLAASRSDSETNQIIDRATTDPVWFGEEILQLRRLPTDAPSENWALDQWQINLFEACADVLRKRAGVPTKVNHEGKNLITVVAPQGPGKTFGLAGLMHWFGACFSPCGIQATAPTQDHIKTRLWGEFAKITARAMPGYREMFKLDQAATEIHWRDDANSLALGEVGKKPESVQGFRRRFSLYLTDETTGIEEAIFPVLFGNMSGAELAILVMIANPTKNTGTFARSHLDPSFSKQFHKMRIRPEDSTRMGEDQRLRLLSYGENSPAYRVRWLGEFVDSDEHQLIPLHWVGEARERASREDGSLPRVRISADVMDGGDDFNEITIARHFQSGMNLLRQIRSSYPAHQGYALLADDIERLWNDWGCSASNGDDVVVDAIGPGSAVVGELMRRGIPVIAYKGGAESGNPKRWRNRRVQSYWVLRSELQQGRVSIDPKFLDKADDWSELEAQLCSIRAKPGTEKLEDLIAKEEMKRDGIKSPDKADSIAMQYATQAPVEQPKPGKPRTPNMYATPSTATIEAPY